MTSQPGKKTITIRILPKISRSNQTMKFVQLIEYNVGNIFFKKNVENEAGKLVPDIFLFSKNLYMR